MASGNREGHGLHTLWGMDRVGPNVEQERENQIRKAVEEAGVLLEPIHYKQLNEYLSLILRWNTRMNLTAVRDPGQMVSRHLVESVVCALALPSAISSLLDFGSGAGLPGIPIAICRPGIAVTLAESQNKKAGFLREAIRVTGLAATVHSGRAEIIESRFDCVALRAVDHMEGAVRAATSLLVPRGWLVVMTSLGSLAAIERSAGQDMTWDKPVALPGGVQRILLVGRLS